MGGEWDLNPRPTDSQSVAQTNRAPPAKDAKITQLVEYNLAKVKVEGSSPFFR